MLETADVDGCGTEEILLGGVASERHEAELIVLGMPHVNPAAPEAQADAAQPPNPPILKEKAVIAFPRTCVNLKLQESNRIAHIAHSGDVLTVVVSELSDDPSVEVTYQLDRRLNVKDVWFSDALRNLHHTLNAQGLLDHALAMGEISKLKDVTLLPPHTTMGRSTAPSLPRP